MNAALNYRLAPWVLFLLMAWVPAQAQVTAESVDLSAYGGALANAGGTTTAISDTLFLVATRGPDGAPETADDGVLLINAIGPGNISTTFLPTPFLSAGSYHNAIRLSSNRAVIQSTGPDGNFGQTDDQVYLLDSLGSANTVTPLSLPYQVQGFSGRPVPVSTSSFVIGTDGPDGSTTTADDEIVLVEGLGGVPTSTAIPTPYLYDEGSAQPVMMSGSSLVVRSEGFMGGEQGAYYVSDLSGAANTSFVAIKNPYALSPGLPVTVTPTSFLLASAGDDDSEESADDELALIEGLGGAPTVTYLPVPNILDYGGAWVQVFSPSLATVGTQGADGSEETADDSIYVLSGIGSTNTLTEVVVGGTDEDIQSRCQRLTSTSCVIATGGADFGYNDTDDEVVVISDLGGTNTLTRISVPGMVSRVGSRTTVVSPDTVVVSNGGPDGFYASGGDDTITVISGLEAGPINVETFPAVGDWAGQTVRAHVTAVVPGASTAAVTSAGLDGSLGTTDDVVRVLFALPQGVPPISFPVPVDHPLWLLLFSLALIGGGLLTLRLRA